MWDLWWTKWHRNRFFSEYFGFPMSISFHRCSIKMEKHRVRVRPQYLLRGPLIKKVRRNLLYKARTNKDLVYTCTHIPLRTVFGTLSPRKIKIRILYKSQDTRHKSDPSPHQTARRKGLCLQRSGCLLSMIWALETERGPLNDKNDIEQPQG
jgi:hypothetical protein